MLITTESGTAAVVPCKRTGKHSVIVVIQHQSFTYFGGLDKKQAEKFACRMALQRNSLFYFEESPHWIKQKE